MTTIVGMRVVRGPDWEGEDSDGGEAHVGTVMEVLGEHSVRVLWDTGVESTCRAGRDGKLDLRIFDTAPVGVRHPGRTCSVCDEVDVAGILWRCVDCTDCTLCPACYSQDRHQLHHRFSRVDTPGSCGVPVKSRKISVNIRSIGMFPGAKVMRGKDWIWGEQDGGMGSKGEVEGFEKAPDSCRSILRVRWPNGAINSYRLGYKGHVDLFCVEEEVGPSYYRDHLPLLDVRDSSLLVKAPSSPTSTTVFAGRSAALSIINKDTKPADEIISQRTADLSDHREDTTQEEAASKESVKQGSRSTSVLPHSEPRNSALTSVDTIIRNGDFAAKKVDLVKMESELFADSKTKSRVHAIQRLHVAIKEDDGIKVKELCQLDPYLVECEYMNITPLTLAVFKGKRKCVRALMELGADVSRCVSSNSARTPMSAAIEGKHEDLVELLLELGANKEHGNKRGATAIHLAVYHNFLGAVKVVVKHGANVNKDDLFVQRLEGKTALHMAFDLKRTDIVEFLLSLPEVDIKIENNCRCNALQLACYADYPWAVELILKRDKSGVDERGSGDATALHYAAHYDHVECVRLLVINGGADVHSRTRFKQATALHDVCFMGNFATAEALVELGADVNVVNVDGDTPLHLAINGKYKSYGQGDRADVEIMCRVQISNMLISAGAFVDARNLKGHTPLSRGKTEVVEGVKMFIKNNKSAVKLKMGRGSVDFSPLDIGGQDNLEETLRGVGLPCGLCGHPTSDVTLYPCQHKCVCSACSVAVTCCPLCDQLVKEKINTGPDDEVFDIEKKFNLM